MIWLGFILECAATAALVGTGVGLVAMGCALLARALGGRVSPGARCDLSLLLGLIPALAALAMVAATAMPSIVSVLGLRPDHCPGHAHHFHVCFIHASDVPPVLASIGAFGLAFWVYRLGILLKGLVQASYGVRSLERLGSVRAGTFPVVMIPGSTICHAVGLFRRRIVLAANLAESL